MSILSTEDNAMHEEQYNTLPPTQPWYYYLLMIAHKTNEDRILWTCGTVECSLTDIGTMLLSTDDNTKFQWEHYLLKTEHNV